MSNLFQNGGGSLWAQGGVEIVQSVSHHVARRSEALAAYRMACIVQHGVHVIDRNQKIAPPCLPDGAPMTPELRAAVAAARAQAGKAYSVEAHRARALNYVKDPELTGILPEVDWDKTFTYIESTLGPPRIVKPLELPTPPGEIQRRMNADFLETIQQDPAKAEAIAVEYAEVCCRANTLRMTWWPPETKDPSWWESYGGAKFPEAWPPHTTTVKDRVDFAVLIERGITFQAWFQKKLVKALGDRLDAYLRNAMDHCTTSSSARTPEALFREAGRPGVMKRWIMDPAALMHIGKQPNEIVVPYRDGSQLIWGGDEFPWGKCFAFAMEPQGFNDAALHIEPENPYTVGFAPVAAMGGEIVPGCFDVSVSYTGTLHIPRLASESCWLAYLV